MSVPDELHRCLDELDIQGLRRLWSQVAPHLHQPQNDAEAEASLHMARTLAESIAVRKRVYSHCWLTDRGLPSQLPDHLRLPLERVGPRIVEGVGIAVRARDPDLQPVADEAQKAMCNVVEEMYADGDTDPELVKSRMREARLKVKRTLLGRIFNG